MPESEIYQKYLDPRALARVKNLELRTRQVVESALTEHRRTVAAALSGWAFSAIRVGSMTHRLSSVKGASMSEMRGADLVVEYLIREKVPYLFGYAGHGAVGLLDLALELEG